ncbi:nucleotidyltransferase domain-containing protein [Actinophytocola oryzae]|nr:hypothetical protein [Actinophytocola oryzae]
MTEKVTRPQLDLIDRITTTLDDRRAWLFGGWGLDARIGHVTREHGDVEFWVDRRDAPEVRRLLVDAGATLLDTQPPEESSEYSWEDTRFSTAYFDARSDGTFTTEGRWDDWVFPAGSFPDERVEFEGLSLLVMSVVGMLAMREQYPHLRNGRPWRDKDIAAVRVLRSMRWTAFRRPSPRRVSARTPRR